MQTSTSSASDAAFNWLIQSITSAATTAEDLWLIDENATEAWQSLPANCNIQMMGNRFDLIDSLKPRYPQAVFSDFDLSAISDASLNRIFYRISKEKPVVHHIANEALRCLKPNGELIVVGHKNEGIKTFIQKISAQFGEPASARKLGEIYHATIIKRAAADFTHLDDQDYTRLRDIAQETKTVELQSSKVQSSEAQSPIFSKPGQFGWNKLDAGSQLLIDTLAALPESISKHLHGRCLDIGCGYGFLTIKAAALTNTRLINHWVLTDNNAAALISAEANCQARDLPATVIVANCAQGIDEKFGLILCNPPFHQGFDVVNSLTERFLQATQTRLAPGGLALFVVNQFIPIERKAERYFAHICTLATNGKFRVVMLSHSPIRLSLD